MCGVMRVSSARPGKAAGNFRLHVGSHTAGTDERAGPGAAAAAARYEKEEVYHCHGALAEGARRKMIRV